jgi:hypothetical protein
VPTRLLLEGPDIEALLTRIRDEHGSSAKIVSADKVRRGGVGGFFAKQRFEIAVEVDDPPAARPVPAGPAGSIVDLLDRADAVESRLSAGPAAPAFAAPARGTAAPVRTRSAPGAAAGTGAAGLGAAGPGAAGPVAGGVGVGGLSPGDLRPAGTRPADRGTETAEDGRGGGSTAATGPAADPEPSTSDGEFAALLASLRSELGEPPPRRRAADPTAVTSALARAGRLQPLAAAYGVIAPTEPPKAGPATPLPPATPAVAPRRSVPAAAEPAAPAVAPRRSLPAAAEPAAEPIWRPAVIPAIPTPAPSPLPDRLIALGVPPEIARTAAGQDRYGATLRAMSGLPPAPPPPGRPGDVLVIVGEIAPAMAVAAAVAEQVRVDPAHVLLAAPTAAAGTVAASRRIRTTAEADRRTRKLHLADTPQVLVLAAPLERLDPQWTQSMLDALRPTAVWAAVDATRKAADLAAYLDQVGPVDAVAVHSVAASFDPATVLGLSLPVSYLDGRPASPAAWAALLCERLAGRPV